MKRRLFYPPRHYLTSHGKQLRSCGSCQVQEDGRAGTRRERNEAALCVCVCVRGFLCADPPDVKTKCLGINALRWVKQWKGVSVPGAPAVGAVPVFLPIR